MFQVLSAKRVNGSTISGSVEHRAHLPRDIGLKTYITKIRPVLEYASPVWGGLPICLEEELHREQNRCLNVIGLLESLVTRRQNLTRKEFKRILESEAHPCKRFLEKPADHGHNLRSCKTNPAHLRIPVSRTVRHSLQNRRDFLRISGKQGRRRGKREANAKRELRARGGSLKIAPVAIPLFKLFRRSNMNAAT